MRVTLQGKRQNSKVHYNLFARQFKPREGPKVTLCNTVLYEIQRFAPASRNRGYVAEVGL